MRQRNKHISWMTLVATMVMATGFIFSACSGDEDTPQQSSDEIRLTADVWRVMEGTRATTFDNAGAMVSEGSFSCAAYNSGTTTKYIDYTTVNWSGGQWVWSDGKHYWPASGSLDFIAYMPATKPDYVSGIVNSIIETGSGPESQPYFTCANLPLALTPTDATKEFIWALAIDQDKAGTNSTNQPTAGQVALNFKHPFARIKFKLSAESGNKVTINSITIPNLYRNGRCTLTGTGTICTWSSLSNNDNNLIISGTPATNDDAVYLVIPNNYGSKTLTVNATWSDWSTVTKDVSASVNFNWAAGNSYTYTLTLSKEGLIVNTEKYTEQW